jgi:hypothetical protein
MQMIFIQNNPKSTLKRKWQKSDSRRSVEWKYELLRGAALFHQGLVITFKILILEWGGNYKYCMSSKNFARDQKIKRNFQSLRA